VKLQALLDDGDARQQLAIRAKQRADALYRWDAIAEKYERVFAQLVRK
jgi:glycosyltransferase involved in cell wall biosynthesis